LYKFDRKLQNVIGKIGIKEEERVKVRRDIIHSVCLIVRWG